MQSFANNPALKSHLENQLNSITELSQKSFDAAHQVSELNMQLARQMIDAWIHLGRALLQTTNPAQMMSTTVSGIQPAAEQLRAYQQELMALLARTQAELARSAQSSLPEASRSASAMADEMVRNAAASASAAASAHHPT